MTHVDISTMKNKELKAKILDNFAKPPYEPINLSKTIELPEGFISLCKRGPSFVPTPQHVDWLQIQTDLDNFSNTMRRQINEYEPCSKVNDPAAVPKPDDDIRPPYEPKFSKIARCNNRAVEVFLECVKSDIFKKTSHEPPKHNLTLPERKALKWWQSNILFNKDSTACIRLQDKGTRFVIVDKPEDILQAEMQIARSSFDKINVDLTEQHIETLKREKISQSWYDFIVNDKAEPGKNSAMYKSHKEGNPVRLITTGCNTAVENLCRIIEAHTYSLVKDIPCRIQDTNHLLKMIDDINKVPENLQNEKNLKKL